LQLPIIAAQAALPPDDVPSGIAINGHSQSVGGSILLSAGQSVFTNKFVSGLQATIPAINAILIFKTGATDMESLLPLDMLQGVLPVCNSTLTEVFYISTAVSVLSIIGSALIE